MKKRYLVSILVGAACLYLAFRKVDWAELRLAFLTADYALIPLVFAAHLAGVAVRVVRWRLILDPVKRAGWRNLLSALSIGFMANFIFPARAGEVIRAYVIGRREGVSKSSCFATVVLERLFDGFAILLFLALFPLFLEVPAGKEEIMHGIRLAGGVAMGVYAAVMAVLFLFSRRPQDFVRVTDWACRPLPQRISAPLRKLVCSFGEGLEILGSPWHVLAVAGWSVVLWTILGLGNWAVMQAFDVRLPVFVGLFLVVVQSFGVMVPSPGFVGAFQYAHVLGLGLFGVSKELALSVGILLHGVLFLTYISLGLIFLWAEGLALGEAASGEPAEGG